ncbi:MAG: aspartate aminotransferase family protein [Alphaproteobacteria bacterium]|nr:aspartate aminotransferase family protein [Alphaproteobacteria bacterium]MDX5369988.1 aspartate aminotransferase family protein [Alphaproteobacteria bacterium]MDX5464566.1 aspartate aminotransferase family protein [Alphaproteobacteria bacterium]
MISSVLPTYARAAMTPVRGEGVHVYAADGRRFLDFGAGIAVNALGHAHPHLVTALTEQAQKLWHVSNLYPIEGQQRLADRLTAATFADTVFFCNSGAEAVEASVKMARRYHYVSGAPERFRIVTFEGAFHGRTLATIAAGGQAKYLEGFGPKVQGFDQVPFGDHDALKAAIGPETAAILIEPIQGEGGVRPVPDVCLRGLRELCDEHGILLILDEVQSGVGRTGKLFAHEYAGIAPDIMAVAKGIGGGFPLGACLATAEAAKGMTAGTHGTTFGGNPLAMAVGNAVLDVVLADGFLDRVNDTANFMTQQLQALRDAHPGLVAEIRGRGLMRGVRLTDAVVNGDVVGKLLDAGVMTVGAGHNVVRLLPPLIVEKEHVREALGRLDAVLTELAGAGKAPERGTA